MGRISDIGVIVGGDGALGSFMLGGVLGGASFFVGWGAVCVLLLNVCAMTTRAIIPTPTNYECIYTFILKVYIHV